MNQTDLRNILLQLRSEVIELQNNQPEENWHALMQKYNMLFLGEKFSVIYSVELVHMLKTKKSIDISLEELHAMLPDVCGALNMKTEALIKASDVGTMKPPVACYSINLI